jgi:hypothetical protein
VYKIYLRVTAGTIFAFIALQAHAQSGPQVRLGKFDHLGAYESTVAEILATPKLTSFTPGCKITSFDIRGIEPNQDTTNPYRSKGPVFSPDQVRYIKSLYKDCLLWINNIHVKCSDGTEYVLGKEKTEFSIYSFKIKE